MPRWSFLGAFILAAGCGGSGSAASSSGTAAEDPGILFPAPQLPAVDAEVIGYPGADVAGLDAYYVTTELGWLGPDGDVVFEAVIKWRVSGELGCGILRRAPDGTVNTILMLGQPLPGTGGGTVRHPRLPLEAKGDTLVMTALINDGDFEQGLFAVPRNGGTPVLLAGRDSGEFLDAKIVDDGTVVVQLYESGKFSVVALPPGGAALSLCDDCKPGFSTDGEHVVVLSGKTAWSFDLDGGGVPLVALGDPAPGTDGVVTAIRSAWVTETGEFVAHLETDDCPEVIVRLGETPDVIAACGAPAPGTAGSFGALVPAAGRGGEVLFGAVIEDDPERSKGIFLARSGTPTELLVADVELALSLPDVVGGDGRAVFGAGVVEDGLAVAQGLFVHRQGAVDCLLTTGAEVTAIADATVAGFMHPVRDGVHVAADGRTLTHIGLREERRPDATLGALMLFR